MNLSVVTPAFCAEEHLDGVVGRILTCTEGRLDRLFIVDDGSVDDTWAVIERWQARDDRIEGMRHAANAGYGAAMKTGLARAMARGAEMVACIHADGQYAPEQLDELMDVMRWRRADLVQGSRIASGTALSGGMPAYKLIANRALTGLANGIFALELTDYYSGYLLYGPRALATIRFDLLSNSFDFDLEVIAAARSARLRIEETAIPTRYGDEVSHLSPIPYGLRVLRVMWRYSRGYYANAVY